MQVIHIFCYFLQFKGYHKQKAYIATQGPLPETVDDFWKMVWDQKTTTIVMLVKEKELGRVKCHKYWPDKGATNTADLQVIHHNETEFPDYVVREFKLVDSSVRFVMMLLKSFFCVINIPFYLK